MKQGMIVCGCVTGTHVIEDIKVAVPHKVAVPISPQQMVNSKDLYRALNSGAIFKLDGGHFHNIQGDQTASAESAGDAAKLRKENKELKRQLLEANMKNEGLQRALMGLNTQLDGILGAIGRLGGPATATAQPTALPAGMMALLQQLVAQGGVAGVPALAVSEVVGGAAPVFLPSEIKPKDAETSIRVEESISAGSSVTNASKRLKEMRKAGEG